MKAADIRVGQFYQLKDGLGTVRVEGACNCGNANCKGFRVWEQNAQEPTAHVRARDLVRSVPDPSLPVITFKSQAALDRFVNAAIAKGRK